ncbi:MAG: response regulator [Synergistales bacterium]|nr:response regulator [Synergistales bacterium]
MGDLVFPFVSARADIKNRRITLNFNQQIIIAISDKKSRMYLSNILKKSGFQVKEWDDLNALFSEVHTVKHPAGALLFHWSQIEKKSTEQVLQEIKKNDSFSHTEFIALSEDWQNIRLRMKARVLGCEDVLAFPPQEGQILTALNVPEGHQQGGGSPGQREEAAGKAKESAKGSRHKGNEDILIVDDASVIRKGLRHLLEQEGYSVREAEDGQEALRKIQSSAPALVLLDLLMPGMDGFSLMERIRKNKFFSNLPIIVITSHGDKPRLLQALQWGAKEFIVKPFHPEVVREKVKRVLGEKVK